MFRHKGKTRTLQHNIKIASLLSFIAGLVNVAGFFAVKRLTTNVTGHFAYFMDEVYKLQFWSGMVYFLYIFSFFIGSFVSNFLLEIVARKDEQYLYIVPASIECLLLIVIGAWGQPLVNSYPDVLACCLLFGMGLQNSLVTTISNSIVRTTHLTGLVTDLGIDLSQLFFYRLKEQKARLHASIRLRFIIIVFFFLGGIAGGILYARFKLMAILFAGLVLMLGLIYDSVKFRIIVMRRKLKNMRHP